MTSLEAQEKNGWKPRSGMRGEKSFCLGELRLLLPSGSEVTWVISRFLGVFEKETLFSVGYSW